MDWMFLLYIFAFIFAGVLLISVYFVFIKSEKKFLVDKSYSSGYTLIKIFAKEGDYSLNIRSSFGTLKYPLFRQGQKLTLHLQEPPDDVRVDWRLK